MRSQKSRDDVLGEKAVTSGHPMRDTGTALALVVLALGLRVYGVSWGLPEGYEEATPLREAWDMWGWGLDRGVDLNPHFFKYPSFAINLQFAAQGLMYVAMKISGAIDSAIAFHLLYLRDKTPLFVLGRLLNVLFGVGTVALVFAFGRRTEGFVAAVAGAFWLAVIALHVSRSQMIEVDVPLSFFTMLTLWFLLRAMEDRSVRSYVYAGLSMGLATSTKYTAALLVLAVVASAVVSHRKGTRRRRPSGPILVLAALAAMVAVFVLTSPFVALDFDTFWAHLSAEREHMRLGHFGSDVTPTWLHYVRLISIDHLGLPLTILAVGGLAYSVGVRRRRWAWMVCAFLVPYSIGISTWEMRADRYLLPLLPLLCLFAGYLLGELLRTRYARRPRPAVRTLAGAALVLAVTVPLVGAYPEHLRRTLPDTRTSAAEWIRDNVPPGSFIVTEHYGPKLMGPVEFIGLDPAIRVGMTRGEDYGRYAVYTMPMFQVAPERAGVYYELSLYRDADYFISTSSVRSRYLREPTRFARQVAFYDSLEAAFLKVIEIDPDGRTGPSIAVFRNPRLEVPFAGRDEVIGTGRVPFQSGVSAFEADFYSQFGFNYEFFGFYREALNCYLTGLNYPIRDPGLMKGLVLSAGRCLVQLGREGEVPALLDEAIASAPTKALREEFRSIKQSTVARMRRTDVPSN